MITANHEALSIRQQCKLLTVNRASIYYKEVMWQHFSGQNFTQFFAVYYTVLFDAARPRILLVTDSH